MTSKRLLFTLALLLIGSPVSQAFATGEQALIPSGGGVPGTNLPKVDTPDTPDTSTTGKGTDKLSGAEKLYNSAKGKVGQAATSVKNAGKSAITAVRNAPVIKPVLDNPNVRAVGKGALAVAKSPYTLFFGKKDGILPDGTKGKVLARPGMAKVGYLTGATLLGVGIYETIEAIKRSREKPADQRDGGAQTGDVGAAYSDVGYGGNAPSFFKVTDSAKPYGNLTKVTLDGAVRKDQNDRMSSFKLRYFTPQGDLYEDSRDPLAYLQATLYSDADYKGASYQIRTEVADLDETPVKNKSVSSLTIEKITKKPGIYVFSDKNFNGTMQYFPPGKTKNIDIPIGSLEVVGGQYQALVYTTPDLTGEPITYRTYSKDLSKEPIGANTIKSIDVKSFNSQSFNLAEGVFVYELPHYNGKFGLLTASGYYDETVFKDFHEGGFRSIKVNGMYDITTRTSVAPSLDLVGSSFVDEETDALVKELEIKKEKTPGSGADPNAVAEGGADPNAVAEGGADPNAVAGGGADPNAVAGDGADPNAVAGGGADLNAATGGGAK